MSGRHHASTAALAVTLAVTLAACSGPARAADVVVYASGSDLESANPLVTIHPLSRQVQRHVLFATLTRYDSALAPQPYYAQRWSWSADRRNLSFELEPSLRWHDGVPVTSADVAFTIATASNPAVGYARAADLADIRAVDTPTPANATIHFATPQREVPRIFAELPIVPAHVLRGVAPAEMRRAAFNVAPTGNGPFRFVERVPGQRWVFERDTAFPAAMGGAPRIRRLVIAVVDEPTTKFAGLASGDLDFAGIAPTMAALARRDPTIDVLDYPVLFTTALVFNVHRSPFDDVRVRHAVDLSIDRRRIVMAALAGYGTPAAGPVPPENPLAAADSLRSDTLRADSLLDAAGWPRGRDGVRARGGKPLAVELLTVGSGDNAVEQLIQSDLAARGIRVAIRQLELAAFLGRARARDKQFDLLLTGIPGDLSLAYLRAMFESTQRGGSLDYADFHDAALDARFRAAATAPSETASREAWRAVQHRLADLAPVAWLYHSRGVQGVAARMRGVTMDLRGELVSVSRWTAEGATSSPAIARR